MAVVGQPLWVRGIAWGCLGWATGPCLGRSPVLTDPGADDGLALASQMQHSLAAFVRALPVVGRLAPSGTPIRWGVLASYRVQIRVVPAPSCTYWPCYQAVLMDAASDAPGETSAREVSRSCSIVRSPRASTYPVQPAQPLSPLRVEHKVVDDRGVRPGYGIRTCMVATRPLRRMVTV